MKAVAVVTARLFIGQKQFACGNRVLPGGRRVAAGICYSFSINCFTRVYRTTSHVVPPIDV